MPSSTKAVCATLVAALAGLSMVHPRQIQAHQVSAADEIEQLKQFLEKKPGTIAIAAAGPRAGEAVFKALQAAEKISSGSIRGVAGFVAMTADGKVHHFSNLGRGGTLTLFIDGEDTGVPPTEEIAAAPFAGVISTGPRERGTLREPPRFPTSGDGIGFVVGHRLPGSVGKSGLPVNHEVFNLMKSGLGAREAVDRVMAVNGDLDAGLIAVDRKGTIAMYNSKLVDKRYDYGRARGEDKPSGAVVETIFNEIHPVGGVAQLVVDVALEIMSKSRVSDYQIAVRAGTPVTLDTESRVEVDDSLVARKITTPVPGHLQGRLTAVVPYILSRVVQNGRTIGYTINEPLSVLENGRIVTVSTQQEMRVWVKKAPRICEHVTPYRTVCDVPQSAPQRKAER